jgi:hypothetical protein
MRHRGSCPVLLEVRPASRPDVRATVRPDKQWFVAPSRRLVDELVGLLREENLLLRPRSAGNGGGNGGGRRFYRPAQRQGPAAPNGPNGNVSPAVTRFD